MTTTNTKSQAIVTNKNNQEDEIIRQEGKMNTNTTMPQAIVTSKRRVRQWQRRS